MNRETEIIRILAAHAGSPREDVAIGIGDDAAVCTPPAGQALVLGTDTLVEGVHFLPGTDPYALGYKSLAVNLSDLAAMGAQPAWALLALSLPQADLAWVEAFAQGFGALARQHGVMLAGGDTTRGPLSVTVQAGGFVPAGQALTRGGARPGDGLYVSGTLGDAALALELLQHGSEPDVALRTRLERPEPRVALGVALRGQAHAVIDISDGLMPDLRKLLEASRCGADIDVDALPCSDAFRAAGGTDAQALAGGDDYELLCALPGPGVPGLVRIGTVTTAPGLRLSRAVAMDEHRHFDG